MPVERKSRKLSTTGAYEGEILQLAAYCLLIEEHYGRPVLSGRLLYQDRSLDVPFDDRLRAKLLNACALCTRLMDYKKSLAATPVQGDAERAASVTPAGTPWRSQSEATDISKIYRPILQFEERAHPGSQKAVFSFRSTLTYQEGEG